MYGSLEQGRPIHFDQTADVVQAASGALQVIGIVCATSSTWTINIYDGIDATGTLLMSGLVLVANTPTPLPFILRKGLYIHTTSGSGNGCVIVGN